MSLRSSSSWDDSSERSESRSESRLVKHSHTFSEAGRGAPVPMWDSSDPNRAPAPLPLNPTFGSNSPLTKPYASSNIEKAAALIASRALESAPSPYTSNPVPGSPEKTTPHKPQHRRMHTIQSGTVGRLSESLEQKSPEKPNFRNSRFGGFDEFTRTPEHSPTRAGPETPTPTTRALKEENTPPSTMLQLSSMRNRQESEPPLADITNGTSKNGPQANINMLSSHILNIQNIATSLQRDMASLTKRSKDNASDLLRLQEATSSRDEDIRNSLRDLMAGLDLKFGNIDSRLLGAPEASRSTPNLPLCLDDREQATPSRKSFTMPRIGSPASFLERDFAASPSMVSIDGAASIAMLEKVLREMATKDGQEHLIQSLELVKAQAGGITPTTIEKTAKTAIDPNIVQKLEEILMFMKDMKADSGSRALIKSPQGEARTASQLDIYLDGEGKSKGTSTEVMNEEVVKTLRNVKQSLSQHGGLTNEVKALVRELRGEVLGMGREIARKLDQNTSSSKELQVSSAGPDQAEIMQVVGQGLAELKEHMHQVAAESRQREPTVDTTEVVAAVQRALADVPQPRAIQDRDPAQDREEMLAAVKEAWEDCKPEIALEHFGLERDEILETLKEGLQSYQPQNTSQQNTGATYEQVLEAVKKGLADYQPPQLEPRQEITEEQIFAAVRQCLQEFEFPLPSINPTESSMSDMTRESMVEAVREGLQSTQLSTTKVGSDLSREEIIEVLREGLNNAPTVSKEVEFNREDLFDAIKSCLEGEQNPLGGMGERVVDAMHEFLDSMKDEFQQYSAANGRDTEQVLDAVKDGLEGLRGEIESYVDRAQDVTGKDEIVDVVKAGFAAMQADMDKGFAQRGPQAVDTPELLDAMEKEFEHLRETIRKTLMSESSAADKNEILDAIRDISDDRGSSLSANSNGEDVARLVKEELEHMRTTLATTLIKSAAGPDRDEILDAIREGLENSRNMPRGADGNESILSNTSELLDAFQDGVDNIRADMQKLLEKPSDGSSSYEILDTLKLGIEDIRADIERIKVKSDDSSDTETRGREVMLHDENGISAQIEALKVMITQLRIKVEAMDIPFPASEGPIVPSEMRVHKEDLDGLHAALDGHARKEDISDVHATLREVQDSLAGLPREMPVPEFSLPEVVMPANAVCKEDTDALETLLVNMKARLDEMDTPDLESVAKASQIDALEEMIKDVKITLEESSTRAPEPTNTEDFTIIQLSLKDLTTSLEEMKEKISSPSSGEGDDADEVKLTKTDLQVLESVCIDIKNRVDEQINPDMEKLASKEDMDEIKDTLKSFREQFDSDNDLTAQAFEARKIEHGGLATKIDDVKNLVAEIRDEVLGKLSGSEESIAEVSKVLGMHHDNMENYATATSMAELSDLVTKGFDAHMEHHTNNKSDMEERHVTLFSKYEEASAELKSQLEEKFNELMTKYDDAQVSAEAKLGAMEENDKARQETNDNVKTVVDDLKILMDTLNTSVTETCEKLSDDSKTVFDIVDQSNIKLGDLQDNNATEHILTREEVAKTLDATTKLEGALADHHAPILAAIKEVLEKVGQHYDHSKQHSETFTNVAEEIKTGVRDIPNAIPPLLPALPAVESAPSVVSDPSDRFDDAPLHEKLDELIAHSALAKDAFATMDSHHTTTGERLASLDKLEGMDEKLSSLDKLSGIDERLMSLDKLNDIDDKLVGLSKLDGMDEKITSTHNQLGNLEKLAALEKLDDIHERVNASAVEITAMVATQTRLMAEHHESQAAEAREAAIALEKRTAQKEQVEADIVRLTGEKDSLIEGMILLRNEQEALMAQTKKLNRDVARLETALTIRQEEMRDMNARAETLERRILEGVMNHARSANLTRQPKPKKMSAAERDASMSLKRAPGNSSNSTARASVKAPSAMGNAIGMALKKRNNGAPKANTSVRASAVDRRILSTSHMNSRPSDFSRAMVLAPANNTGLVSLKRSQSVKSNPSTYRSGRKPSWTGPESMVTDKENQSVLEDGDDRSVSGSSDEGTERRSSYGNTSYMYTDSALSRDSRRSTSYASSMGGTLNRNNESILEEEEEDSHDDIDDSIQHDIDDLTYHEDGTRAMVLANGNDDAEGDSDEEEDDELGDLPDHGLISHHEAKYAAPSDSGLGTEPTTPDQSSAWNSTLTT